MPDQGRYKMGTIARMTGFSPALLRAWERRHEILIPERTPSGHRLYTDKDLQALHRVRVLLEQGRSIGEIAHAGRSALLASAPEPSTVGGIDETPASSTGATGSLSDRLCEQIVAAAVAIDGRGIASALDQAFATLSPMVAIETVIGKAAAEIGRLWAEGKCGIAGEHLASALFRSRLLRLLEAGQQDEDFAPLALTACFPDEQHDVGAIVSSYRLTQLGYRISYLGPDLPFEEVERAMVSLKPACVFLSVGREVLLHAHKHHVIRLLKRFGDQARIVIGGQGVVNADKDIERAGGLLWLAGRPLTELGQALAAFSRKSSSRAAGRNGRAPGVKRGGTSRRRRG
jgi:DNA-binding transcriptional MerR regulator